MIARQHVYPVNDLREHDMEGVECWCNPEVDDEDNIVIHNAADDREAFETGARLPC